MLVDEELGGILKASRYGKHFAIDNSSGSGGEAIQVIYLSNFVLDDLRFVYTYTLMPKCTYMSEHSIKIKQIFGNNFRSTGNKVWLKSQVLD